LARPLHGLELFWREALEGGELLLLVFCVAFSGVEAEVAVSSPAIQTRRVGGRYVQVMSRAMHF